MPQELYLNLLPSHITVAIWYLATLQSTHTEKHMWKATNSGWMGSSSRAYMT